MTHFGSRLGFAQYSQFVTCSLWDEVLAPFHIPWSHLNLSVVVFGRMSAFDQFRPGTNRTVVYHRQASFRVRRRWLRVPVLPPEAGSRKCPHIAFLRSAVISTFQACQKSSSALTTMRLSIKRCNLRTVSIWRFGTLSVGLRGFRVARQRYRPPRLAASSSPYVRRGAPTVPAILKRVARSSSSWACMARARHSSARRL